MVNAFLDSQGNVISIGKTDVSIEEVQNKSPSVVEKIENVPDSLKPYRPLDPRPEATVYHKKISGDGTSINDYDVIQNLDTYKSAKNQEIDAKTRKLIECGFEFDNNKFSMSINAQQNWSWMQSSLINGVLSSSDFPRSVSTIDDKSYIIDSISDASLFCISYVNRIEQRLESGRELKSQINQCTTKGQIDLILDDRQESDQPINVVSGKRQDVFSADFKEWKYEVSEFDKKNLSSVKRYKTDNGNGTYSGLLQEIIYNYSGNKLMSRTFNQYDKNENIINTITEEFSSIGDNEIRKFNDV